MGEGIYIAPVSTYEYIFLIIIMLFTCLQIAFIINRMGSIIQAFNKNKEKYYQD